MAKSNYLETEILEHIFKGIAIFTPLTNLYVALYTANPTDADSGTEVTGGSYARVAVAVGSGWTLTSNAVTNAAAIAFPQATADWGTITHFGLRSASSGGNLLYHGALAVSKVIANGDTARFEAGELDVSED